MSADTPSDPSLQGGVAGPMASAGADFTSAVQAAMAGGEDLDGRRRQLASELPGTGAPVLIPQVPYGPSVGKWDLGLPAVGEGYEAVSPPAPRQIASHGPERPLASMPAELVTGRRPVYNAPEVGGEGFAANDGQVAMPGADMARGLQMARGLADYAFGPPGTDFVLISPGAPAAPRRPGLLGRVLGRLRRPAVRP
jgi:hypothetical protein